MNITSLIFLAIIIVIILACAVFGALSIIKRINRKRREIEFEEMQKIFASESRKKQFIFIKENDRERKFITIAALDIAEAEKTMAQRYPDWKVTFVQQR